jgi:hypothetical protein
MGGHAVIREHISSPFALWRVALFPVVFLAMFLYVAWKAATGDISAVIHVLPGFPEWSRWLVLTAGGAFTIYMCRMFMVLKRVTLVHDRLFIDDLTTRVEIPLSQVQSIEWTQTAADWNTPEAALVLRQPTPFGTYILFEPRSEEAFELLSSRIEESHRE